MGELRELIHLVPCRSVLEKIPCGNKAITGVSSVLWQSCLSKSPCSFLFPEKPYITVSHKKGPYYEITSGHKSLKLAAKVDAFPRPTVTW